MRLCMVCKKRPMPKHFNSKYCLHCRKERLTRPISTLTREQIQEARALIGTMSREDIAERLGCSVPNLKRAFRGKRLWFKNGKYKNRPDLVKQVITHYERHGKASTINAFPGVNVKCIVDRPLYYGIKMRHRQMRWTDDQIIELARMGGIISLKSQARHFKRPGANEGSIRSAWSKKFKHGGGTVHGMSEFMARHLVEKSCPHVKTPFWSQRKSSGVCRRKLYLWVDMQSHLKPEVPKFIKEAISQMAQFQCWLFQSSNPKRAIKNLIRTRERSS